MRIVVRSTIPAPLSAPPERSRAAPPAVRPVPIGDLRGGGDPPGQRIPPGTSRGKAGPCTRHAAAARTGDRSRRLPVEHVELHARARYYSICDRQSDVVTFKADSVLANLLCESRGERDRHDRGDHEPLPDRSSVARPLIEPGRMSPATNAACHRLLPFCSLKTPNQDIVDLSAGPPDQNLVWTRQLALPFRLLSAIDTSRTFDALQTLARAK